MAKLKARPACARCRTWRVNWRTGGHRRMLAVKFAQIVMPWQEKKQRVNVYIGPSGGPLELLGQALVYGVSLHFPVRNCVAL